jgi:hypothetical protein
MKLSDLNLFVAGISFGISAMSLATGLPLVLGVMNFLFGVLNIYAWKKLRDSL